MFFDHLCKCLNKETPLPVTIFRAVFGQSHLFGQCRDIINVENIFEVNGTSELIIFGQINASKL